MIITRFEWDEDKDKIDIGKHGIAFSDAAFVFTDASSFTEADDVWAKNVGGRPPAVCSPLSS